MVTERTRLTLQGLQTIGWSHLAPGPLPLADGVTVFAGGNGSGKTSALGALGALLGARRFGGGRSPTLYIHRDHNGAAAREAWVLAQARVSDSATGAAAERTLVMQVTPNRRRFTLLDHRLQGHLHHHDAADPATVGVIHVRLDQDLAE